MKATERAGGDGVKRKGEERQKRCSTSTRMKDVAMREKGEERGTEEERAGKRKK